MSTTPIQKSATQNLLEAKALLEDYVNVEKFQTTKKCSSANIDDDKKSLQKPSLLLSSMQGTAMRMFSKGIKKFRTKIPIRFAGAGAANLLAANVFAIGPTLSSVTESSIFASVFDEVRCHGFSVHARISASTTITTPSVAWALVYDPANIGAYTSVVGTVLADQVIGPVALTRQLDGGLSPETQSGYVKKSFKVPSASLTPIPTAGSPCVGQAWIATSDIASLVGYLKLAVDALGAGVSAEYDIFVIFDVEYRSRT
jgi:hypothetical protein